MGCDKIISLLAIWIFLSRRSWRVKNLFAETETDMHIPIPQFMRDHCAAYILVVISLTCIGTGIIGYRASDPIAPLTRSRGFASRLAVRHSDGRIEFPVNREFPVLKIAPGTLCELVSIDRDGNRDDGVEFSRGQLQECILAIW